MKSYFCHCGHEVVAEKTPAPIRWNDGHVCRFGETAFNRCSEQCVRCACYYLNAEVEVKDLNEKLLKLYHIELRS